MYSTQGENNQSLGFESDSAASLSSLSPESEGPSADGALGAVEVCVRPRAAACRIRVKVSVAAHGSHGHGERESLEGKNPVHQKVAMCTVKKSVKNGDGRI